MNVDKGTKMFVNHQQWRKSYVPLGYIEEADIREQLDSKKFFIQGYDKKGRPISVVLIARHFSSKNLEEYLRK